MKSNEIHAFLIVFSLSDPAALPLWLLLCWAADRAPRQQTAAGAGGFQRTSRAAGRG